LGQDKDAEQARQGRIVALVIAGTMIGWIVAQWLGKQVGMDNRFAVLIDLAALAGFFWALVVTLQIWRNRRDN